MEHPFYTVSAGSQLAGAMELFNRCSREGETLYREFSSLEAFSEVFSERRDGVPTACITDDGAGCFGSGCLSADRQKGYITFLGVRKDLRRRGLGRALLACLEQQLQTLAEGKLKCFEISFFNPMNLVWTVPGTRDHVHPNAPGAELTACPFLEACGYRTYAIQNAYHLDLRSCQMAPALARKKAELEQQGIRIAVYDPRRHRGLEALLEDLGNPLWQQEILAEVRDPRGAPVLIVDREGWAMGFTGPMKVEETGRGYLAGLAVHRDCRGLGAGKLLFGELCVRLRELGAGYMTLFTGENNPARRIYEAQGFEIVSTWADMRRQV